MGELRQLILQAINLKKDPPKSHIIVRSILEQQSPEAVFEEYQVIEHKGGCRLVNFYREKEAIAIELCDQSDEEYFGKVTILKVDRHQINDLSQKTRIQQLIARSTKEIRTILHSDRLTPQLSQIHINQIPSSDSISEIIGQPPGWLLRSGISTLAVVVILLLGQAHMISYPDKLIAKGYITTEEPPIAIISPKSAIIDELFITNGQQVSIGDKILCYKNTADRSDVDTYFQWIQNSKRGNVLLLSAQLNLGSLQSNYAQLLLLLKEYEEVLGHRSANNQISNLRAELNDIASLQRIIDIEKSHFFIEEKLANKELNRARQMYKEGLIAKLELEQTERNFEQFARQVQSPIKVKVQNDIRSDQLKLEIKKITEERTTQLRNYRFKLNQLFTQIEEEIDNWYHQNIIYAEIDGVIELAENIEPKYATTTRDPVGFIIPLKKDNNKIIQSKLSVSGIGKVTLGTLCFIKVDSYPYKEFGVVKSKVATISQLPTMTESGSVYDITINLPDQIKTDYHYTIPYKPNMTAIIEVITEDKSVLERLTEQLIDLIK